MSLLNLRLGDAAKARALELKDLPVTVFDTRTGILYTGGTLCTIAYNPKRSQVVLSNRNKAIVCTTVYVHANKPELVLA
jgi:hypothetical protein